SVPVIGTGKRTFHAIKGEIPSPLKPPSGCAFHPRCTLAGPRCRVEAPRLTQAASLHSVACHINDGGTGA
ncbi:MAG: ABC transporter ATP-binding protein, partial [Gemmobacter sp.]|nr:ABC transporter ATP-binding protein [Gemmobacter sp.]